MAPAAVRYTNSESIAAGVFAGSVFMGSLVATSVILWGDRAGLVPLRSAAALVLGKAALDQVSPPLFPILVGATIWLVLSIALAVTFSTMVNPLWSKAMVTSAGILFGIGVWCVNAFTIAPVTGGTWHSGRMTPALLLAAYAFLFGCPLGWFLASAHDSSDTG